MSLTRELKELWAFGPLRALNEGEAGANAKIEEDSKEVAKLVDSLAKKEEDEDEKAA
jgi:Surfeit locus protein 5 subunit 22 of Mediator complex